VAKILQERINQFWVKVRRRQGDHGIMGGQLGCQEKIDLDGKTTALVSFPTKKDKISTQERKFSTLHGENCHWGEPISAPPQLDASL